MLTVALFTIAKSWNQTTDPSTHECIMDTRAHISGTLFSSKEKKLKVNRVDLRESLIHCWWDTNWYSHWVYKAFSEDETILKLKDITCRFFIAVRNHMIPCLSDAVVLGFVIFSMRLLGEP